MNNSKNHYAAADAAEAVARAAEAAEADPDALDGEISRVVDDFSRGDVAAGVSADLAEADADALADADAEEADADTELVEADGDVLQLGDDWFRYFL